MAGAASKPSKSKTGDPACIAAATLLALGLITPAAEAQLGLCRKEAHGGAAAKAAALIAARKTLAAKRAARAARKAAAKPPGPELGFRTGLGRAFSETRPGVAVTPALKGQMTAYADRHFSGWSKDLSAPEARALRSYVGSGYKKINDQLRAGHLDSKIGDKVARIDAAIAKAAIPEDVVAFRGVKDFKAVTGIKLADAEGLVGSTIRDKGYLSMSLDRSTATSTSFLHTTGKGTYFVVSVPKGSSVAPIAAARVRIGGEKAATESEMLAGRGSGLKVTQVVRRTVNGVPHTYIYADLVPPEG